MRARSCKCKRTVSFRGRLSDRLRWQRYPFVTVWAASIASGGYCAHKRGFGPSTTIRNTAEMQSSTGITRICGNPWESVARRQGFSSRISAKLLNRKCFGHNIRVCNGL
jgi:hypothetical protein